MPKAFLTRLDRLDAKINAPVTPDKTDKRKLRRDRELLLQDYAKLMDESGFSSFTYVDGRIISPIWSVEGFARQKSSEARSWLASKGVSWDGSAKSLRREITTLLESGVAVPTGAFGLHVSRTVLIRAGIPSRVARRMAR